MYLKISDEAKKKLDVYMEENIVPILDLDDGVGEFSSVGNCSLGTNFRLLLLDKNQNRQSFNAKLDSDIGEIYIKDYSKKYLDEEMLLMINPRLQSLQLSGPSGVLNSNLPIVDLRT
ncbi:iron-sulfur cluster biosynthesis family protein [Melissococcus plutonius]|uniref:Core domain-containing protein n=1 Tax=Melissococcus plutonius TaxID=33970 RepID=A0A2Z5Y0N8_9ENTE|nr:iron-sulfur cluster biosynthesis family protein [Melissococcus plutonius]BAL61484.1 hypothetical protein MPD5_0178 [Melissococcus plutonius DAT561]MCV2498882.1 iron-sulfur cluster biosynthesis family protein [Melissococcus plutonius]MCV2501849.1 iron-sulfur cluster biosynthesis family protein [Melissococcus plutonius]MCV2504840.1 iron-sulfur cluster biosynthesis family protein [Melissococcus plutonius]MCV2507498.1 iron-sulfur cluster biosynthesis family protein [Melissococcus plutonius]